MLSHFSWLQYGVFTGVFLLIYYGFVLLRYYREEAKTWLKSGVKPREKQAPNSIPEAGSEELTGAIAREEGVSNASLDELHLSREELLLGALPDCMQEVKEIVFQAGEEELDKAELFGLLQGLTARYPQLLSGNLFPSFYAFVAQECNEGLLYEVSEKEIKTFFEKQPGKGGKLAAGGAAVLLLLMQLTAHAQDGNNGISEATNKVKGYFDTGCDLMYAIGAIVGLVGAIKVYSKWNAGEPDTGKVATSWFGSCIFLVVVATVLKSFFGI